MKNVCVITSSRADFGLLSPIIEEISNDKTMQLQIIATGSHLSPEFGSTLSEIIENGYEVDRKIDINLSDNSVIGMGNSLSSSINGFIKSFKDLMPEICIILGDRYEIFGAAIAATLSQIPLAHIHGGETTEGAFDESFRHAITKMSHIHFCSADQYRKRIIQLGENPENVYNFGGLGAEQITRCKFLDKYVLEKEIGISFRKKNILVAYHPTTLDRVPSYETFKELLSCLAELKDTSIIFTKANADTGSAQINQLIDEFVSLNSNSKSFYSLGQQKFWSLMRQVDAIVGNSSSGILEAPSFKIGVINIGDRQKGRIHSQNVINCEPSAHSIRAAIKNLYSSSFQKSLKNSRNLFEKRDTARNIVKVIRSISLKGILKKAFNDINYSI